MTTTNIFVFFPIQVIIKRHELWCHNLCGYKWNKFPSFFYDVHFTQSNYCVEKRDKRETRNWRKKEYIKGTWLKHRSVHIILFINWRSYIFSSQLNFLYSFSWLLAQSLVQIDWKDKTTVRRCIFWDILLVNSTMPSWWKRLVLWNVFFFGQKIFTF